MGRPGRSWLVDIGAALGAFLAIVAIAHAATYLFPNSGSLDYITTANLVQGAETAVDIRRPPFNAVCDGTDQNTAVQAALAAGWTSIFIPPGCAWVPPLVAGQNLTPAGVAFYGGDWQTSVIACSLTNPASCAVWIGPLGSISNINIKTQSCVDPVTGQYSCPVKLVVNANSSPLDYLAGPYSPLEIQSRTGGDYPMLQCRVPNGGQGDCIYLESEAGSGATALRTMNSSVAAGSAGAMFDRQASGNAVLINDSDPAGAGILMRMQSSTQTGGAMLQLDQNTSASAADLLQIHAADGSGSFTGNFFRARENNVDFAFVDSTGAIYSRGGFSTGAGHLNGVNCSGPPTAGFTVTFGIVTAC